MKRRLRLTKGIVFFLASVALLSHAMAQGQQVSGKVTSGEDGTVLPYVNVLVKGTTIGAITDENGAYAISVPDEDATLVFSYIGFVSQEVNIGGRSVINITLESELTSLQEVVVVGYGTQKRENIIGSVAEVSAEQLDSRPVTQLSNALTGQMPGVTVIQRSGQPGNSAGAINVRGVGSFGASAGALVVVDGIPGEFNDIDPNDVASISVLKDASSAAIYGSRAANGVILITTKSGQSEKMQISYNGYAGFQQPTRFPEFVNSWEFAELFNEATGSVTYTPEDIQKYRDGSDRDNYPNTNFIEEVLSKQGLQTGHNVSISSGSPLTQYNLSMGYLYQDGLVIKNNFERYNVRLNLKTALSKKLDLTVRLAGIRTSVNEPATPSTSDDAMFSIIGGAVRNPSIFAGRLSNGDFGPGVTGKGTPISHLASESFAENRGTNLNSNLRLDYELIEGLKLSGIAAYNQRNGRSKHFRATQRLNDNIFLGPNDLTVANTGNYYYTLQALADYTKRFDEHEIGILVGYSFEENRFEASETFRDNLPSNSLTEINVGSPENQQSYGTANEWALESQFARVNYSFKNRYLVEGVIRRDGSSRFPPTQKYAYFPSAAVGWRVGQESFIRDNADWISELKLKASYGVLGNQNIPNYPYQNTYEIGTNYNYPFGGNIYSGIARTTITDPTLHWESTRTTDVGVEVGLLENKVNFSATYFDRYTYDILYAPSGSVSNTLGFNLSKQNTGSLSNTGWEFTLGHNHTAGDLSYGINANLSIINNEVLDLGVGNIDQPNGMVGNGSTLFIGYPMQIYYGYEADGIFVNDADVSAYPDQSEINPGAQPGDIRYKDISGPDGVPDGEVDPTYDRVVLGSNIPKYTFGINLSAGFKGFDFSLLLQGVSGVKGFMQNDFGWAFFNQGSVQKWQMDERWTEENPRADAGYPRMELISNAGTPNTLMSSFWVIDASYIRAKNIQLGYTFPQELTEKIGITNLRLYASGENVFTIDKYRPGWDPEVAEVSGSDSDPAITDGNIYPLMRNFTFGLNVKF